MAEPRANINWRVSRQALKAIDEFAAERREFRSDALRALVRYALDHRSEVSRLYPPWFT